MTKTTAEKIAIMQAYDRGEMIEVAHRGHARYFNLAELDQGENKTTYGASKWNWHEFDYRIAAPDPVPHTIDWSHVAEGFDYLFTAFDGCYLLCNQKPKIEDGHFFLELGSIGYPVDGLASFKPGNMPWQDSLVVRPVDANK